MEQLNSTIYDPRLEAGALALEFANTADWHASENPVESLNRYADLVHWAARTHLIAGPEVELLLQRADKTPSLAETIRISAINLREAIYRLFAAAQPSTAADLAILNEVLHQALPHLQLNQAGSSFAWVWANNDQTLDQLLWPVAYAAAALLTSDLLERVKECEDDRGCGFLLLDMSKNRSRRWCSMDSCGNRAKVRRYRKRQDTEGEN
jgi:predicted RNA-binding Zn ribbon-like protein